MAALIRRPIIVAAMTALAACAGPQADRAGGGETALARNYVFAACLIAAYPGTPLATEADIWAGGLVQRGHLPAEAYPRLTELARTMTPAPLSSTAGTPMRLESCVALRDDSAVARAVAKAVR